MGRDSGPHLRRKQVAFVATAAEESEELCSSSSSSSSLSLLLLFQQHFGWVRVSVVSRWCEWKWSSKNFEVGEGSRELQKWG